MSNDADAKLCYPPPDADVKPSRFRHKSPESLVGDAGEIEEIEDPGKRSLHWVNSVFPLISLIQIDSTYQESGGDAYKAAGILGAELADPEESPNSYGKKRSVHKKKKRVAASTGSLVSLGRTIGNQPHLAATGEEAGVIQ
ncbi:hypothetical protein KSP40_PGU011287 [Platanthera guangdongensis]|uniref:At5g58720/SDE5-like UBA-like domain-containing protein n=1 Tax=Platanthera guangdongensis TaxID=2320717 RepID=A0ABR2MMW2_9ASPA